MPSVRTDRSLEEVVAAVLHADLVVGIPSYNNAKTIGHVATTAVQGLSRYFPGRPALVLNSDGGSSDGTPVAMTSAAAETRAKLDGVLAGPVRVDTMKYRGPSGKGSAFRDIFEAAHRLGAEAVVVLDADLRSVSPEWIHRLASPIAAGHFDFVAPLYRRHKYDGTITNSIIYPMTSALFGGDVRQPIGGDFGVGRAALDVLLGDEVWDTDVARFGVDIWMTTTALVNRLRVAQAHLGAKVHDPKDPGQHLAKMLVEVVGTFFSLVGRYSGIWLNAHERPSAAERLGTSPAAEVTGVNVNVQRLVDQFSFGVRTLGGVYRHVLPAPLFDRIATLSDAGESGQFDDATWARTVYSFALAYHRRTMPRDQLLSSLTPLYLGRVASFVVANSDSSEAAAEERVEQLARVFHELSEEFAAAWRAERSQS